jgi:hypothetical protein
MVTMTFALWMDLWAMFSRRRAERAGSAQNIAKEAATPEQRRTSRRKAEASQGRWVACVVPGAAAGSCPTGSFLGPLD